MQKATLTNTGAVTATAGAIEQKAGGKLWNEKAVSAGTTVKMTSTGAEIQNDTTVTAGTTLTQDAHYHPDQYGRCPSHWY